MADIRPVRYAYVLKINNLVVDEIKYDILLVKFHSNSQRGTKDTVITFSNSRNCAII